MIFGVFNTEKHIKSEKNDKKSFKISEAELD
jgi:hypothetical protein